MPGLMAASDVVVGNAGGATGLEALARMGTSASSIAAC